MKVRYNKYSTYLKNKYNTKVYKIPVNIDGTCPNRVDTNRGCIYCGDAGTGFEMLDCKIPIKEQLKRNINYISKKYNAKKFIAFFQNFSNTFMPLDDFKKMVNEAVIDDICEICISTRPDCINEKYLDILKDIEIEHNISISIELGLQTVNYKTLEFINRNHTLAEFIDAVIMIKKYNFFITTHLIINLPNDELIDIIEAAKIISALNVNSVKLHSLNIIKNTELEKMYLNNEFDIISKDEYIERVITFIRYCSPNIVFQRLLKRAPKEYTVFSNWDISWRKIDNEINKILEENDYNQGDLFNYLNGKAVKRFEVKNEEIS